VVGTGTQELGWQKKGRAPVTGGGTGGELWTEEETWGGGKCQEKYSGVKKKREPKKKG